MRITHTHSHIPPQPKSDAWCMHYTNYHALKDTWRARHTNHKLGLFFWCIAWWPMCAAQLDGGARSLIIGGHRWWAAQNYKTLRGGCISTDSQVFGVLRFSFNTAYSQRTAQPTSHTGAQGHIQGQYGFTAERQLCGLLASCRGHSIPSAIRTATAGCQYAQCCPQCHRQSVRTVRKFRRHDQVL